MARRRRAERRDVVADPKYNHAVIARLINCIMQRGKKSTAQQIVYGALDVLREKVKDKDPVEVLVQAVDNIKPRLEVKSRRVGGATYQVPIEVSSDRQQALAFRWIKGFAQGRKGTPMPEALAYELLDAFNNQGNAIKKRDDTHKMAQANKAFAHYRW
jgi:small subunit ribosomal protein S7